MKKTDSGGGGSATSSGRAPAGSGGAPAGLGAARGGVGTGVRVVGIEKDNTEPRLVHDPSHPHAILSGPREGYVEYPNINIVTEMVDLISASRAYEANAAVIQGSKEMFQRALEIGR